jgi:hypothetical protein
MSELLLKAFVILFWERIFPVNRRDRPVCHPKMIKIYGIITLSVVLYGCETWSLTVTEERRLRVFESGVQRRIFGPKRDEVTREWRKLHNEEFNYLYSSNTIRVIKSWKNVMDGACSTYGEEERCVRGFVGKT